MTSRTITIAGYAVIVLAGLVLESLSRLPGSGIPSFAELLDHAMASRTGRLGVLAAWVWVGLHFFAR